MRVRLAVLFCDICIVLTEAETENVLDIASEHDHELELHGLAFSFSHIPSPGGRILSMILSRAVEVFVLKTNVKYAFLYGICV